MSSHRPPRHDGSDAEGGPTVAFWHQNGTVVATTTTISSSSTTTTTGGDTPRPGLVTPAVPKMGVRARIADWPPKRDVTKDPPTFRDGNREPTSWRSSPGGHQALGGVSGFKALHRLARRRSKEVEFQEEGWSRGSPAKALAPLRHRSSSEVTLSECDPEEGAESRGNPGLFREYGSTSSIDVQGISEQSFFQMLNEFRNGKTQPKLENAGDGAFPPGSSPEGLKTGGKKEEPSTQPKEKPRRRCPKGEESIFKKLRSGRNEGETGKEAEEPRGTGTTPPEPGKPWMCPKSFAHYDVQSMLFDLGVVATKRAVVAQRRNTTTGASAASAPAFRSTGGGVPGGSDSSFSNIEDLNRKENLERDLGDATSNELLLSCPHFRNEIGGSVERNVSFSKASAGSPGVTGKEIGGGSSSSSSSSSLKEPPLPLRPTNAGVSVLEVPKELQRNLNRLKHHSVEHVDLGARYYRDHFHGKATKAGTGRGLPLRDALEYVVPELNIHCLRLALSTPKVTEQLLKLDEQGGVPNIPRGVPKVPRRVPNADSTGTHSLYTTYQDYEIMFHVSTMLPYTPNNPQQLLRKRHIGNDIVTIIFQEPGALPFTPQNIRSHFQHVFIIVRAHNPCTDNVCYSVAVTRSKDVPPFGPPIPNGVTFRKSDVFRDFLLAKVINAENAAHKSDKFHTMATRTRQEYLKDLAENYVTNTPIDSTGKFNLISLASKKKEKTKARVGAEQHSAGAIAWRVSAQDFARGAEISCILGISNEFLVLLDLGAKEVVFNCFCGDVIGWTADASTLKIFYGRGDHIFIRAAEGGPEDIKEIVQRLKVVTEGCETVDMTLRRNGLGQLGFHVKYDGTVAEVEDYGFAWQAGLRQGSRLVEICKVAVVTLSHDQMIDLLRTSVTVKVVIIPPHEDGAPRRGWAESVEPSSVGEPKGGDGESLPSGYRPPYRSSPGWQWSGPASHNNPPPGHGPALGRGGNKPSVAYREPQALHGK
ncbi:PREDICTED: signal-induced proliferation-associated 1-like protein 3, partial [Calidris pugnax]|uniref:signal-induced proliferation-associated 1-like protein 3 n=1 Tax=Calidris pugnax TaxID=198806 RepID=UPI00071E65C1